MPAPDPIRQLVERFNQQRDAYLSGQYNETQLRREFLDPFFEQLGWDVHNCQGYAEAYKDVIHEDAIRVGGATKAPDYCFRIGGTRKFFVEAKKPSVNLGDDAGPAFQLRRYAWSAKLPLSILTSFNEFAVYDCRIKPDKADKASTARTLYLTGDDYLDRWDEIASIFSRDAILKGSFDRYAASGRRKKGTAEVDDAFLGEIEQWRDELARHIALRNPNLSQRELNFAVQRTIDRIIFLRICEDRGIEEYGQLLALLNGTEVYRRLCEIFYRADHRYNSGLFHFQPEKDRAEPPDQLTLSLAVDDMPLKDILRGLYYPDSPYEFSVLPADILGHVYEQFLGKVIRLTAGHRAIVDEKPEVRKAGGVYYTPTYIVEYIVRNTIGRMLEGKTSKDICGGGGKNAWPLRILDPACGSGSFLLGAYQYLLDWYRDRYVADDPKKWAIGRSPRLFQAAGGEWRLTTAEQKRILLEHIYGVDIDPQAVEVTKLSLLLKVLEGESEETLTRQLRLFGERALPDLGRNIKCGNSLIGPDFYHNHQADLFDEEDRYRINAFNWRKEFQDTLGEPNTESQQGHAGFDIVMGNPPYGMVTSPEYKHYFEKRFITLEGRYDNYELFLEKGIGLTRYGGMLGFIVPSPVLTNVYARKLRRYVSSECAIRDITNFGIPVFRDPTVHSCILILRRGRNPRQMTAIRKQVRSSDQLKRKCDFRIPQRALGANANYVFDIFAAPDIQRIMEKMERSGKRLGEICHIRQCIKTGNDADCLCWADKPPGKKWKPSLRGRSINRYATIETDLYVKYGPWLARNWKNKSFYERAKIAVRETGNRIIATLDRDNRYFLSSLYSVYPKQENEKHSVHYILGILNSALATYYLKAIALDITRGAFAKFRANQLARLPIRQIRFSDRDEKKMHALIGRLVERMLLLNAKIARSRGGHEETVDRRYLAYTDDRIDELVYELYGLSDEEIAFVEESLKQVPENDVMEPME